MKKAALLLFALLLVVYVLSAGGHFYSQDEEVLFYVTEGIAERGDPSVPWVPSAGSIQGRDGKQYGITELTQSLLAVPFYWAGKWLSGFYPSIFRQFFTRFAVSFFSVPVTATTAVLLLVFAKQLGYAKKTSVVLALVFGIATIAWPYATMFFRAASQTLGLLASILALFMHKRRGGFRWLVLAGCVFGFTTSIKIMTVVALPGILLYLWLIARNGYGKAWLVGFVRESVVFGVAALPWAVLYLGYNYYRFGSLLDTGYNSVAATRFDTPLYIGLYGLLLSPGRSVFLYSPPLLLALWSGKTFWEKHRDEAWLIGAVCTVNILVYATFHAWHGENSWGPRYLVPLTPLLLLPIGAWLDDDRALKIRRISLSRRHTVFGSLVVLGVVVQVAGVSLYFNNYYSRAMKALPVLPDRSGSAGYQFLSEFHFNPEYSPLVGHWRYIWPYAINLWSGKESTKPTETIASQIMLDSPYFPIDPVEMQMYFVHEANNLDFWWVNWHESVYPTIQAANRGNLAGWIAQCIVPAPPLDDDSSLREFHIQPLRRLFFDCMQSWVYPEAGDSSGFYALHGQVLQESVTFLQLKLGQLELAFAHDAYDALGPAFRLFAYRPSNQTWPYLQEVRVASSDMVPEQVVEARPVVSVPIRLDGPLDFLGYRVFDVRPEAVALETWWEVTDKPERPLSIMAHLVDADGHPVAVDDGLGVPVDNWRVGDILVQYHSFPLTSDLSGKVYWLQTGAYWLDTMERHRVIGAGQDTGDRILLEEIRLSDGP